MPGCSVGAALGCAVGPAVGPGGDAVETETFVGAVVRPGIGLVGNDSVLGPEGSETWVVVAGEMTPAAVVGSEVVVAML